MKKFKKLLTIGLAVLLMLCMSISLLGCEQSESKTESLQFQQIEGKQEYSVIGLGSVSGTNITIPNTFNGLPVTSIGDSAFENCTNITNVAIPNSITNIGDCAFWDCARLTNCSIPNSVKNIGDYAFAHCKRLTNITIPNSVISMGWCVFRDCTSLSIIYCEAERKPDHWENDWNVQYDPVGSDKVFFAVEWGYGN